ncbi:DUF3800 domain-containing protein [Chryseobacterium cucumeris]|uniref:DUF3800 domain-containing protein n=1 Tax=Chryseobacterium cucumeris TaxID=1813611 RepID=UPI002455B8E1|nr:DUF3800 domain-containing protein [Chryseobacterium cucumeris]MDH5035435.1 DUF3800 domain-containing protein [Chryseobacterium cucumeris]
MSYNNVNIYCDESSHIESLKSSTIMGLGALSCPTDHKEEVFKEIKNIKEKHGFNKNFEIKWSKVSSSKIAFYKDLVNYYFDNDFLGFRCVIIDKSKLNHSQHNTSHDEFYYKMIFLLIRELLHTDKSYKIYLDKKDTNGRKKIEKLHEFLCNKNYDYKKEIVKNVQEVVSHQIELVQICDLLMGAVCYENRKLDSNNGKVELINLIKERSGYSLTKKTFPSEHKFNILIWESK